MLQQNQQRSLHLRWQDRLRRSYGRLLLLLFDEVAQLSQRAWRDEQRPCHSGNDRPKLLLDDLQR